MYYVLSDGRLYRLGARSFRKLMLAIAREEPYSLDDLGVQVPIYDLSKIDSPEASDLLATLKK